MDDCRRWIRVAWQLWVAASLVFFLTACVDWSAQLPIPEWVRWSKEAEVEEVHLQLMGWPGAPKENDYLQALVAAFQESHAHWQVTLNLTTEYEHALQAAFTALPPDVLYVDSFRLLSLVEADALAPAPTGLASLEEIHPSLRAAFAVEKSPYCLPRDVNVLALAYNKRLFDRAGLDYPDASWTWRELRAAAEALTDGKNGIYGLVLSADMSRWLAFLYQAGGQLMATDGAGVTIHSPAALEAVQFYVNLALDGYAALPEEVDSIWGGEAFGREKAAIAIEANWLAPYLAREFPHVEYGLSELPAGPAGKATIAFTTCFAVSADSRHPAEAFQLAGYLANGENILGWTDLNQALPALTLLHDDWLARDASLSPFLRGLDYAHPWQLAVGMEDALEVFNNGLRAAMAEELSPAELLSRVEAVMNAGRLR